MVHQEARIPAGWDGSERPALRQRHGRPGEVEQLAERGESATPVESDEDAERHGTDALQRPPSVDAGSSGRRMQRQTERAAGDVRLGLRFVVFRPAAASGRVLIRFRRVFQSAGIESDLQGADGRAQQHDQLQRCRQGGQRQSVAADDATILAADVAPPKQ